jgi:hypothetical protein
MRVALILKPGAQQTGIGRYASELAQELSQLGHEVIMVYPIVPLPAILTNWVHHRLGWDLHAFFNNYPIWVHYPKSIDIYHLSSQNLATLMFFCPPPGKTIISIMDIIPYLFRNNPNINVYQNLPTKLFDWVAMQGLKRASFLISISEHTRKNVIETLGIAPEKIQTILLAM